MINRTVLGELSARSQNLPKREPELEKLWRRYGGKTPKKRAFVHRRSYLKLVHELANRKGINLKEKCPKREFWVDFVEFFGCGGQNMLPSNSPRSMEKIWRDEFCISKGMKKGPHSHCEFCDDYPNPDSRENVYKTDSRKLVYKRKLLISPSKCPLPNFNKGSEILSAMHAPSSTTLIGNLQENVEVGITTRDAEGTVYSQRTSDEFENNFDEESQTSDINSNDPNLLFSQRTSNEFQNEIFVDGPELVENQSETIVLSQRTSEDLEQELEFHDPSNPDNEVHDLTKPRDSGVGGLSAQEVNVGLDTHPVFSQRTENEFEREIALKDGQCEDIPHNPLSLVQLQDQDRSEEIEETAGVDFKPETNNDIVSQLQGSPPGGPVNGCAPPALDGWQGGDVGVRGAISGAGGAGGGDPGGIQAEENVLQVTVGGNAADLEELADKKLTRCDICKKPVSAANLQRHRKTHLPPSCKSNEKTRCPFCGKLKNSNRLRDHIEGLQKNGVGCSKTFDNITYEERVLMPKFKDGKIKCDRCHRYLKKSTLKNHKRSCKDEHFEIQEVVEAAVNPIPANHEHLDIQELGDGAVNLIPANPTNVEKNGNNQRDGDQPLLDDVDVAPKPGGSDNFDNSENELEDGFESDSNEQSSDVAPVVGGSLNSGCISSLAKGNLELVKDGEKLSVRDERPLTNEEEQSESEEVGLKDDEELEDLRKQTGTLADSEHEENRLEDNRSRLDVEKTPLDQKKASEYEEKQSDDDERAGSLMEDEMKLLDNLETEAEVENGEKLLRTLKTVQGKHEDFKEYRTRREKEEGPLVEVFIAHLKENSGVCFLSETAKDQGYVKETTTDGDLTDNLMRRVIPFIREKKECAQFLLELDDSNFSQRLLTIDLIKELVNRSGNYHFILSFENNYLSR